ncbi:ABC transporter substrate-binding protein [Euhalothece natronophila Z-M001]|uniref:ABC transporter substrate-binding protein n=1 Tax=Euhalothece natronophila Z-M001 TaxID=522448 RepID=A0A5B8NJU9_9CHRO|nr:ABC transporter substrate-binding protein [Euhalothece natronophila]QDZ39208.1 ABC transporter substrate-binding protein [Euhalothece natronophila Z-M001]
MLSQSHQKSLIALLLSFLATLLTACDPTMLEGTALETPQVVQSVLSDPKTFNAILSQESPNVFGLTYEGLVDENPITGEIEPELAESWEISDNQQEITFTLREGLKWSDGEPLTADDVVFTYNDLILNPDIPNNIRDSLRIGETGEFPTIEKIDDLQVKFTVPEPFAPLLQAAGNAPIMPKHALEASVEETDSEGTPAFLSKWGVDAPPEEIIVNGRYKLANYATSERVTFQKNPYYWKTDEDGNQLPYIDRVIWQIVENQDTALMQFRSRNLDSISVSPEYFSLLKREEEERNFTIHNGGPQYGTTFIGFNLNTGSRNGEPLVEPYKSRWFNNLNFRKAIAHGINRQQMINNIHRGLGKPQNSPISVQSPFYNENVSSYEYDLDKAEELLFSEGFEYNDNGNLVDEEGNRVRFTLITNAGNQTREAMAAQISQDLDKLGITVDLNPMQFNVLVDRLSNSLDWECHLLGFTGGNEPHFGISLWRVDGNLHTFNQAPRSEEDSLEGREIRDWEEEIERLYIEAGRELDEERRKELYGEAQEIVQDKLPYIYLVNPLSLAAVRDHIEGVEYSALGGAFWNIEELQLSAE